MNKTVSTPSTRTDLYQVVTDQIIAALEAGTPPWVCPWQRGEVDPNPANLSTGRGYRGINVLLLNLQSQIRGYRVNRWLTYTQAQSLGGTIRRGEHGTAIVFFKMHEIGNSDSYVAPAAPPTERTTIPLLRSFTVFNLDQVDGLDDQYLPTPAPYALWESIDAAERLIELSGATVREGGDRAFYQPTNDFIQLPPRGSFTTASDYYATALHELTHWTGHESRCNRVLGKRHGIEPYAFEELVAELGSAFLTNHCRMTGKMQHASYIDSWLQALRNDRRLIFTAAAQAQRAADFLLPKHVVDPEPETAVLMAA